MDGASGVKTLFLAPLTIYPVALLLMAAHGWWTDNAEAVFAAPITALLFMLLEYPVAVVVLWIVHRRWPERPARFPVAAAVALALAAHFALIWPLGLFRFSLPFMATVVGATALTWAGLYAALRRRKKKPATGAG